MNNDYWDRRKAKLIHEQLEKSEEVFSEINSLYEANKEYVNTQLDKVLNRFSKEYGLTTQELDLLISKLNGKYDSNEIKKVIELLPDSDGLKLVKNDLGSAAYVFRINRYDKFLKELDILQKNIAQKETSFNKEVYKDIINDTYNKSIFEIQKRVGLDFNFNELNPSVVEGILSQRWSGKNYSERIWENTTVLANELKKEVALAFISGKNYSKTIDDVTRRFDVSKSKSRRLVRTEAAFFYNESEALAYAECDIDKYRFIATLDLRTSDICRKHDFKIYKVSERKVGVNFPPMHVYCRSTTIAHLDDDWIDSTKRRAINVDTDKSAILPKSISYDEWYNSKIKSRFNVSNLTQNDFDKTKSDYYKIKSVLGDVDVLSSIDKFIDLKYNNSESYDKLIDNYIVTEHIKTGFYGSKINPEKQAPHNELTRGEGKSYLYKHVNPQDLFDKYAGKGEIEKHKRKLTNKEICVADYVIGVDYITGEETRGFKIHHSKKRTHIVPKKIKEV